MARKPAPKIENLAAAAIGELDRDVVTLAVVTLAREVVDAQTRLGLFQQQIAYANQRITALEAIILSRSVNGRNFAGRLRWLLTGK